MNLRRRLTEPAGPASNTCADHATASAEHAPSPATDLQAPAPIPAAPGNAPIGRLLRSAQGRASPPDDFADRLPPGGGQPIPEQPRQDLESGLGASLSSVRLHTDAASAALASDI